MTMTERTAQNLGARAYREDALINACPHPADSYLAAAWCEGWRRAHRYCVEQETWVRGMKRRQWHGREDTEVDYDEIAGCLAEAADAEDYDSE